MCGAHARRDGIWLSGDGSGTLGVVEFDDNFRAISLEEKPKHRNQTGRLPGFISTTVKSWSSKAGEAVRAWRTGDYLHQPDYLEAGNLTVELLGRGFAWLEPVLTTA